MFDKLRKAFGAGHGRTGSQAKSEAATSQPPPIVDVTDADFGAVVEHSPHLAVVDFWADWCEPCRIMSAYMGFLASDYAGRVLVAALDVDENPATAERFAVMGLPTLLLLKDGQEVGRIVGITPYEQIKDQVEAALHP